jgi:N-acetylneuraminic acid mutarotase
MTPRTACLLLMTAFISTTNCSTHACGTEPQPHGQQLAWSTLAPLPDERGVAGVFAGVSGRDPQSSVLVVAGGANFPGQPPWAGGTKTWHAAAYVLPKPDGAWRIAAPLPRPLGYGVSVSYGGRVWCVGGGDATEHVRSTVSLEWDAATNTLRVEPDALPPLPEAMAFGSGVLVGSRLFIAGGQTTPAATEGLGTFWSIDLAVAAADRRWQEHPSWPGPKRILPVLGTTAGQGEGKVFLVSGAELVPDRAAAANAGSTAKPVVSRRFLTDAYEFDIMKNSWRAIAPCPKPLIAAPSPAIPLDASRLVFLPGDDGSLFLKQKELAGNHPGFPRQMYVYDTRGNAWHAAGTVPTGVRPAVTTPTVAWRGGWIVPSGEVQPGLRSPQIVRLLPEKAGNDNTSTEPRPQ